MKQFYIKEALCFDDILLVPRHSGVTSRHSVDLSMNIGFDESEISLSLPIIAAPMDTVCDIDMCIAMHKQGGLGILHRYMSYDDQISKSQYMIDHNVRFGVAVASNNGYLDHVQKLYDVGVRIILVDTANGHSVYAINAVESIRNKFSDIHIMAGNVATAEGFLRLAKVGANSIRVGIGGGSACTTRIVSGHGIPTLSSIMDCAELLENESLTCSIIADGGIRNSGDMVKCFAAGADAVMVGSMLAGTDESPGDIITNESGNHMKSFRGMASTNAQMDANGRVSVSEGISTYVPYKGSVYPILDQIRGGLGSGCSYSGCYGLRELSFFSAYVKVSPSVMNESKPHANAH